MKARNFWILGIVLMLAAGPAFAGKALQMWSCGIEGDVTEEDIQSNATSWLASVKTLDGGENLEAWVLFPVAVNSVGQTDFMIVVSAPTFAEWGKFWDAYPDSDAAQTEREGIFCPDSVIWDATKVE